jgi:hypothetical protein
LRIVRALDDHSEDVTSNPEHKKFLIAHDAQSDIESAGEIMAYNDILQSIENDSEDSPYWRGFTAITAHQGPLKDHDPGYNGSSYSVQIEWESGKTTCKPLAIIADSNPITCAVYARDKNLLDTPGWKHFKGIAEREQKLLRLFKQAKLRSFRTSIKYKSPLSTSMALRYLRITSEHWNWTVAQAILSGRTLLCWKWNSFGTTILSSTTV